MDMSKFEVQSHQIKNSQGLPIFILADFTKKSLVWLWGAAIESVLKIFQIFLYSLKDISLSFPQRLKKVKKVYPLPNSSHKPGPRSNFDLASQKGWLKAITWYFETFYCIPVIFMHFFIIAISIDFWFDQLFGNQSPSNKKFVRIYKK